MSGLTREAFLSLSSRFNGCLMNIALEGFVLSQAWHYFYHFHRSDAVWLQCLVGSVVFLTAAQTAALWQTLWEGFVDHFNDPSYAAILPVGLGLAAGFTAVISFLVQGYFVRRCYHFIGKNKIFLAIASLLLAYILVDGLYVCVLVTKPNLDFGARYLKSVTITYGSWMAVSAFLDVMTTSILLWQLKTARARTNFEDTKHFIVRICIIIMNTCVISTSLMIASVVLFFTQTTVRFAFASDCHVLILKADHLLRRFVRAYIENLRDEHASPTCMSQSPAARLKRRSKQRNSIHYFRSLSSPTASPFELSIDDEKDIMPLETMRSEFNGAIRVDTSVHVDKDDSFA